MNFTESHWSVDLIPMNGSLPEMAPDDSGFDLTNRMEHQAKPICNDKSLNLALDCDNCDAGYPKVDLCIQWTESQTQNGSFKVIFTRICSNSSERVLKNCINVHHYCKITVKKRFCSV